MEFYLMKKEYISCYGNPGSGRSNGYRKFVNSVSLGEHELAQRDTKDGRLVEDPFNEQLVQLKECFGLLKDAELGNSQGFTCEDCGHLNDIEIERPARARNSLEMKLSSSASESAVYGGRTSASTDPLTLKVELSGYALKVLKAAFGEKIKIGLEFVFENTTTTKFDTDALSTTSSKMTIKTLAEFKDLCQGVMDLPACLKTSWLEGQYVRAQMNIVAYLGPPVDPKADEVLVATKQMLDEEVGTDVQIVCGEGQRVHCHSGFLIAHSDVLRSMLLSDMKERKSREVLMDDMSLEEVKAFLGYLYYRGVDKAEKNCGLAVELFKAGNKYMIESLKKTMKEILMMKPDSWFKVDAVLSLFFFVSKVDGHEDLKMKAIEVLKAKSKEVQCSEVLNQLFRENPVAAREIFQAVLSA